MALHTTIIGTDRSDLPLPDTFGTIDMALIPVVEWAGRGPQPQQRPAEISLEEVERARETRNDRRPFPNIPRVGIIMREANPALDRLIRAYPILEPIEDPDIPRF